MTDSNSCLVFLIIVVLFLCYNYSCKKSRPVVLVKPSCGGEESEIVSPFANKDEAPDADDYQTYVMQNGLEKGVFDSHKRFVSDLRQTPRGSSSLTETSHDENINPWVGLRRPDYTSVKVSEHAREVPTQTPEQLYDSSNKKRYGYF